MIHSRKFEFSEAKNSHYNDWLFINSHYTFIGDKYFSIKRKHKIITFAAQITFASIQATNQSFAT